MTPKYLQNELLNELYINTMELIKSSNLSVEAKQEHLIQACNVFAFSFSRITPYTNRYGRSANTLASVYTFQEL